MSLKAKPNFYVVSNNIQKKLVNVNEKQDDMGMSPTGQYLTPEIKWHALSLAYENSFVLSGICEKIATSCDSGFEKLSENIDVELETLLDTMDLKLMFLNMIVYGNSFNEVVKTLAGKIVTIDPIITQTMYCKRGGGYLQIGGSKQVNFEELDVMQFMLTSPKSKYYGDSIFSKCVSQIALLVNIDKYYKKLFDNSLIHPTLLMDETKELSDTDKDAMKILIQDTIKGLENSFSTVIIPGKLSKVDIVDKPDTTAFLGYRKELIKSIAVSINIPYGMLINDSSNRATSDTEYNTFTKEVVAPLQRQFLRQLKYNLKQLKIYNPKAIDELYFKSVDVKNQKTEMETWTGYKTAGIITANEVRTQIGYETMDGADVLSASKTPAETQTQLDQTTATIKSLYE